jgi:hypothetical protein
MIIFEFILAFSFSDGKHDEHDEHDPTKHGGHHHGASHSASVSTLHENVELGQVIHVKT